MDYCEIFDFPLPKNQLVLTTIYLLLKYNKNFGSLCTKKVSLSIILLEHPGMYLYQIAAKSLPQEEF